MSPSNNYGNALTEQSSDELAMMRPRLGRLKGTHFSDSTGEHMTTPIGESARLGTVLLRNRDTGLFYGAAGKWVELKETASTFASSYNAIETAVSLPEQKLEVVFSFEDPLYDITIPIKQVERV